MGQKIVPNVESYVPALDGIRAASVLTVILAHFGLDVVLPGGFGVTMFFWISGFLITGQLLGELRRKGRVDFPQFYLRRLLRLIPAAFAYIIIAGTVFTLAGGVITLAGWLAALFYGANYYDLFVGYTWLTDIVPNPLTHLWSLAVEEHYYLLWPGALVLLIHRRAAGWFLVGLCVAILAWRFGLYQACYVGNAPGPEGGVCGHLVQYRLYKSTDTRLDSIAWGALVAVLAASSWTGSLERLLASRWVQAAALAIFLSTFLIRGEQFREVWRYSLQPITLCVLIPVVCGTPNIARRILEYPACVYVGRLSYSLYLWHWGAFCLAEATSPTHSVRWVLTAALCTVLGAVISYYAVERPMIALRRRAGSHAKAEPDPPAIVRSAI